MKLVIGGALGALLLSLATTFYHAARFPELPHDPQYSLIWLLHTIPTGAALGLAMIAALSTRPGFGRALRCFTGALLAAVPFGIQAYLRISLDPFHALTILWEMVQLFVPSLLGIGYLLFWGLFSLRPARFRTSTDDTAEDE